MKFKPISATVAVSECGRFECRKAEHGPSGKSFLNVWDQETGKHIAAGFKREDVSAQCDRYVERFSA